MFKPMMKVTAAVALMLGVSLAQPVHAAADHEKALRSIVAEKILPWTRDAKVVDAIKAQNSKHASLDNAKIVSLDKTWRAQTKSADKPMIEGILGNDLSAFLKKIKADSKGLFTEIFVMDNKGLNVGQSDVTSDYWQGDEAKWKKTYLAGADAVHVGKVKKDESTQRFQSQVSVSIVDPATKAVIGAVTVGIDMEALGL
ncbi:MAG: hypothetical protein R3229_06220 [Alphaproteobacteria bacterium]|nr:hypothetical protein [Alphaproteobacteria bacterium]